MYQKNFRKFLPNYLPKSLELIQFISQFSQNWDISARSLVILVEHLLSLERNPLLHPAQLYPVPRLLPKNLVKKQRNPRDLNNTNRERDQRNPREQRKIRKTRVLKHQRRIRKTKDRKVKRRIRKQKAQRNQTRVKRPRTLTLLDLKPEFGKSWKDNIYLEVWKWLF